MADQEPTLVTDYQRPDPYCWLADDEGYELPREWVEAMSVPELHSIRIIASYDQDGVARQAAFLGPLFHDLDYGVLSLAEREFIGVVVSALNSCVTCLIIHTHRLGECIGDHGRARRIAVNYRTVALSSEERAIADYCVKLTTSPGRLEPADLQALRDSGIDDAKIYYIIELAAAFNLTNRLTAGYGMRPDDEFMAQITPPID